MQKEKILVIDDDDNILKLIQLNLERSGYNVLISENGDDGFEKIQMVKPDLVITDFMIPGMSGLELLKKTKEEYSEIIMIIMTAYGSQRIAVEAMKNGADDYVIKPFIPEELLLMVEKHLENKKIKKEVEVFKKELKKIKINTNKIQSIAKEDYAFNQEQNHNAILELDYPKITRIISQEFISPLSIIYGYLQFLIKNSPDDGNKEILTKIGKILGKFNDSIKELIIFSNSNDDMMFEWININYILEEVFRTVEDKLFDKKIHLVKNFKQVHNIKGDSKQLYYMFHNLILNAIYFTDNNGEISVLTKIDESFVTAEITDNGKGIAKENLKKIFDPFFTTKSPGSGLGLGLSIVQNVILKHNGTIKVKSNINQGSTFIISLPNNSNH